VGGDHQLGGRRRLCSQGSRQSNLVLFGSAREGSDPVSCRHVRGSLGLVLAPSRGPGHIQHSRHAQLAGEPTSLSPVKRVWGQYAGVMCGRWWLLWWSTKTPHRTGRGQSWSPKARSSHSSLSFPSLFPFTGEEGRLEGGGVAFQKPRFVRFTCKPYKFLVNW
jgi:hypothetical protein